MSLLALAGCGISPRSARPHDSESAAPHGPVVAARAHSVFTRPLLNPQVVVTAAGVYAAWQVSRPGSADVRTELARINPRTGRIEASQELGGTYMQGLSAAGFLWLMTWTTTGESLLRLSPRTLRITWQSQLGSGSPGGWWASTMAVADGGLWAADGHRLVRLLLPAGRVTASISLPGADTSDVSANAAGTVLIVGESDNEGGGEVQRRDPRTGALLGSRSFQGVAAPIVAGPVHGVVWVSEATGMMGYVQRLYAATLSPDAHGCDEGASTDTCVVGTNAISARIADGLLWVSQPGGGDVRNYCARPSDGRPIAPTGIEEQVLAIAPDGIFCAVQGPRAEEYLRRARIPANC
jgi:hypothetical protein